MPSPRTPPTYDDEPDVAWAYGFVDGANEPTDELFALLRERIAAYAEQRARELGRPVRLVGAMEWDTPRLRALPRWVRELVVSSVPAPLRAGRRRLRRDVTLVRAWQHTDYRGDWQS